MTPSDGFALPKPGPLSLLMTVTARAPAAFVLPLALQAAALARPAAFDLEAAQHNLRKAFLPAKD